MAEKIKALPYWLRELYPFKRQTFLTAGGARMSYLDEGPREAEAILLLHGNPTWSFYYRNLVRAISPRMRCIAPDHVGMGLSEKPEHYDYTLATRIADVTALVESLGLRRVHLVVHDWGGAIGFGWAVRHPGLVGRIVILNTAAFPDKRLPLRIALCKAPVIGPAIVRGLNGFAGPATWMSMHRRVLSATEKRAYLFPYDSWDNRVAVSAFVRDIPRQPGHPSWSTLEATSAGLAGLQQHPALIVWGRRDFCFNDRFLARWQKLFPNAEKRLIEDGGHYVLEDAADEVIPVIGRFLTAARVEGSAPHPQYYRA